MVNIMQLMPELEGDEMVFVQGLIKDMDDSQVQMFANSYRTHRKDSTTLLMVSLAGFLGVAGIHRFMLDQIGMGILYLLTGGFCGIGTIIDLINIKKMAFEYNQLKAQQVAMMIKNS